MAPMKLHFLKNAGRAATKGGKLLRNVEAVVRYGTPEQRVSAVKKVIEQAGALASHETSAHVVEAVCEVCDNTMRVQLLFSLRKRILDLCRQRAGSGIINLLLTKLPARNKVELAESISAELLDLARHKVGSHVVRKLLEVPATCEVVSPALEEAFGLLTTNEVGQFVAAAMVTASVERIPDLLTPDLIDSVLETLDESEVLAVALRSPRLDDTVKQRIGEKLSASAAAFVEARRHNLVISAACALDNSTGKWVASLRAIVCDALSSKQAEYPITKGQVGVAVAIVQAGASDQRKAMIRALSEACTAQEAAEHPYASTLLRAAIDQPDCHAFFPKRYLASLSEQAARLAAVPAGSQVVQRLISSPNSALRDAAIASLMSGDLVAAANDPAASFVVQALLDQLEGDARNELVEKLAASFADLVVHANGTHVAQKVVALSTDSVFTSLATDHLDQLQEWSLDRFACFCVRSMIRSAQSRGLVPVRREIVNKLKLVVGPLGRSPWAGHIVLAGLLEVASDELAAAIRNVIFLKCEDFLASPRDATDDMQVKPAPRHSAPPKAKQGPTAEASPPAPSIAPSKKRARNSD